MYRRAAVTLAIILLLSAGALTGSWAAGATRAWTVLAGGGSGDHTIELNAFFPRTVEIGVGDTVTWQIIGFHQVAFLGGEPMPRVDLMQNDRIVLNPKVLFPVGGRTYDGSGYWNSGIPPDPSKPYSPSLTFTKAGTFRYVCIIHGPGMGGTIVVKDGAVAASPAAVVASGRRAQAAAIRSGESMWRRHAVVRQGRDITVPMIGDLRTGVSIMRFTREPLRVPLGATVTWVMRDPFEIHTVTFTGGQPPPQFEIVEPQAQGPPVVYINPRGAAPTAHRTYDGTGYVNSGILFSTSTPPDLPKSYSLTFVKAGRYEYWCLPHVPLGMKGVIIVGE